MPYKYNLAVDADSDSLTGLITETPMPGPVTISMERAPNYFLASAVQSTQPLVYVGRENGTGVITSVFAAGKRPVYVNGKIKQVRYLADLRIHPEHRSRHVMKQGFKFIRDTLMNSGEYAQTLILRGNDHAVKLLTSGRAGLPMYHPFGDYSSNAVFLGPTVRERPGSLEIHQAHASDLPAMQRFFNAEAPKKQFYPHYDFTELDTAYYRGLDPSCFYIALDAQDIVGIAGVWDQQAYKQTRIVDYSRTLRLVRPLRNMVARIQNRLLLPAAGSCIPSITLHTVVIRNNDPEIFSRLLRRITNTCSSESYAYMLYGFDASDPLNTAFAGYRKMDCSGRHFLVSYSGDPRPTLDSRLFYFEAARI